MKNKYSYIILFILSLAFLSGCSNVSTTSDVEQLRSINEKHEVEILELKRLLGVYEDRIVSLSDQIEKIQSSINRVDFLSSLYADITMEGIIHSSYKEDGFTVYEVDLPFSEDSLTSYDIAVLFGKENQIGFEYNRISLPGISYIDTGETDKVRCKFSIDIHEEDEIIMIIAYEKNAGLLWRHEIFTTPIEDI